MIIGALIVIILALLMVIFAMMPGFSKVNSQLEIIGNDTFDEGNSTLQIKLTDINGTALANQTVNITITDENQTRDYHSVVTDDEGIGELKLDKNAGKYNVSVAYGGNNNYNESSIIKEITIEKKVVEAQVSASSAQSKTYASGLNDDEIEGYIQRDLDVRAQNGVKGYYDYEEARSFYENVPPTGME